MILNVEEKNNRIIMHIRIVKNKPILYLIDRCLHLSQLEYWEQLESKLLNHKFMKEYKKILKGNYYLLSAKEDFYYYWDSTDTNIYRIVWQKIKAENINFNIGSTLYHLTNPINVDSILKEGLKPSCFSKDGVYYGVNKIFFSTKPIIKEDEEYIDAHLLNRIQLEIVYDGSFDLYRDFEYEGEHPMVYTLVNTNIPVNKISEIQPIRRYN